MRKSDHTTLARAYARYDRLTAYGSALRHEPYDEPRCRAAWDGYQAAKVAVWGEAVRDRWEWHDLTGVVDA